MQETEGDPIHPTPTRDIACDYKNEPANDKQDYAQVEREHEISKRFVHGRGRFVKPNVRAKTAPTVGRQAQATENVHRTRGLGLVARRWGSA